MKIQYVSDLHLEFFSEAPFLEKTNNVSTLILAGDICKVADIPRHMQFFKDISAKFENIYYVLGNHEHYSFNIYETESTIIRLFSEYNIRNIYLLKAGIIHFLSNNVVILGDTLWTDCNNNDPITKSIIQRNMNDYRIITSGGFRKLLPDETCELHNNALKILDNCTMGLLNKKIILVTHHGMSHKSVHLKYRDDYHMNGAFVSQLDEFFYRHQNIEYHIHGHVHDTFSYEIGPCTILTNPRGYPIKNHLGCTFENPNFIETKTFDI